MNKNRGRYRWNGPNHPHPPSGRTWAGDVDPGDARGVVGVGEPGPALSPIDPCPVVTTSGFGPTLDPALPLFP